MNVASLIFWIVCAAPLLGIIYYILREDKAKRRWSMLLLAFLFIFALFVIITVTKDFEPRY